MRDITEPWQKILAQGFSSVESLLHFLQLPQELGSSFAEKEFKTRVPQRFVNRMQVGNPHDPLLLQVLASGRELALQENYSADPLQEKAANPLQGLIHKYQGRVLLILTGACAINCRFCFRRHFPYAENNPGRVNWKNVFHQLAEDKSIHEVILSGGDPLLAPDAQFEWLFSELMEIKHLKTLRIHTRIPVVLPERIQDSFLLLLEKLPLRKVVVLHVNHPNELDDSVYDACQKLKQANCHLLNQTVLLKDVNNDSAILTALSEKLFDYGVLPYYLHCLDKVAGAAHFDMPMEESLALFHQLQNQLPGYLVPRLVREEAGKRSKTWFV